RAVAEEHRLAKARRDAGLRARHRFPRMADAARRVDLGVDLRVLRRRRRRLQHAALAQPRVLAALGEERTDAGHDLVAGGAERERLLVAEQLAERRQVRPVAVAEAAVAAARPPAAKLSLEERDRRLGRRLAQRE